MIYFKEKSHTETTSYFEMHISGFNLRKALEKQAEQLNYYLAGKPYESLVREQIAKITNITNCDIDTEMPIS